jgi:hypothetical protein
MDRVVNTMFPNRCKKKRVGIELRQMLERRVKDITEKKVVA